MFLIKTLIVYNPKSGNGLIHNKINDICLYLKNHEVSVFYSSFEKEITSYLFLNCVRFETVIVFGGDGTLHEAINGIMKSNKKPNILYIPSGSVNDFAKHIGVGKKYEKELKLLDLKPQKIDVYQVDADYFIYTIGCGKFTNISYDKKFYFVKKYFKQFFYYFKLFQDLFVKHKHMIKVCSDNDDDSGSYFMFLFLAINNVAGFKIRGAKNKINDGKIKLYLFKYRKFLSVFILFAFYVFKRKNKYFIKEIEGEKFHIKSDTILNLNLDGEGPTYKSEFTVKVIHNALNFYIRKN